jgi:hypothetical protein
VRPGSTIAINPTVYEKLVSPTEREKKGGDKITVEDQEVRIVSLYGRLD